MGAEHFTLTTNRPLTDKTKVVKRNIMLCTPKILFFIFFEHLLNNRFDLVYESLTIGHGFLIFKAISAMWTFRFDKKGLFDAV